MACRGVRMSAGQNTAFGCGVRKPVGRVRRISVSERLGHSSVATTAAIYSHAIRGKDRAAAQVWDDLMQQSRGEKPGAVN